MLIFAAIIDPLVINSFSDSRFTGDLIGFSWHVLRKVGQVVVIVGNDRDRPFSKTR